MTLMIMLVGEQPMSNLLPALHLKPSSYLLAYTKRTEEQAKQLRGIVGGSFLGDAEVDPYNIKTVFDKLESSIQTFKDNSIVFNLTGGTKTMAFAAYDLAQKMKCDFVYLQSEGSKNVLHRYVFQGGAHQPVSPEEIKELIDLDMYFRAHGLAYSDGKFCVGDGEWFERAVVGVLVSAGFEVKHGITFTKFGRQLEIDIAVRKKNQVGLIECKLSPSRKGIDQLNTAGGREFLGTYVKKFLVCNRTMSTSQQMLNLKDLAEARNVTPIELTSSSNPTLSQVDTQRLIEMVSKQIC